MKTVPAPAPGTGLVAALLLTAVGVVAAGALRAPPARAAAVVRIDLNAAGAAELTLIPGIGPRLADRILDEREAHGPFRSVDELRRVNGIGPVIAERARRVARADALGADSDGADSDWAGSVEAPPAEAPR